MQPLCTKPGVGGEELGYRAHAEGLPERSAFLEKVPEKERAKNVPGPPQERSNA